LPPGFPLERERCGAGIRGGTAAARLTVGGFAKAA